MEPVTVDFISGLLCGLAVWALWSWVADIRKMRRLIRMVQR